LRSAWLISRAWTLDLGLGNQGGHRVHHHQVHRPRSHQDLDDLEGLLAGVGLGDEEVVHVHPELPGVLDVEGVLGIDVGRHPARLLDVGHQVEAERGLAGRLGAVDLRDPAPGHPAPSA